MLHHKGTKKIETERLILRKFKENDAIDMYNNWASDSEVTKYLTWSAHGSIETSKGLIGMWIEDYSNKEHYQWAVSLKEDGQVIGSISLTAIDNDNENCEVGYCIGKNFWNKGIVTEAFSKVIEFAFNEIGFQRIGARHDISNTASGRVMEKCGLKYEGTLRKIDRDNSGNLIDCSYYSILQLHYTREKCNNMYTKSEILNMAKKQLALDYNCELSDFEKEGNTITENILIEGRRIYESDGCFLKILCIGGKAIICADEKIRPWLEEKVLNKDASWLFDYGNVRTIDNKLREFGHEIDEMPNFYLPNPVISDIKPLTKIKWFEKDEILQFQGDSRFDQAFGFEDSFPDVLGVAALDGDIIMGMAGASEDGKILHQIGIDVLPGYRGKGIGTNLVAILKQELLRRGKVPFYGTSVSHMVSRNIAINAGFFPVWVELYSKK